MSDDDSYIFGGEPDEFDDAYVDADTLRYWHTVREQYFPSLVEGTTKKRGGKHKAKSKDKDEEVPQEKPQTHETASTVPQALREMFSFAHSTIAWNEPTKAGTCEERSEERSEERDDFAIIPTESDDFAIATPASDS